MTNATSGTSTAVRTAPLGIVFWIMMLIADTAGQTASDTINGRFGLDRPGSLAVGCVLVVAAMVVVFSQKRYVPWSFWATVAVCSVLGTALSDYMTGHYRMSSLAAAAIFAAALAAVLALWSALERTLSVEAVVSVRQEAFYWLAIVATLGFGTSFGDVVANGLDIGDRTTALVFAVAVAAVAVAHLRFGLKAVPAFWLAFVLMQPASNSLGDLLSQPMKNGGIGAGALAASLVLFALLAALIVYERRSRIPTA